MTTHRTDMLDIDGAPVAASLALRLAARRTYRRTRRGGYAPIAARTITLDALGL